MNLIEYEKRLRELAEDEFHKFNSDFGGGQLTIEQRLRQFADSPEHERRICQLLGLETESDKLTKAAINSANAAMLSASSARISMIWSGIASLAALIAAAIAIIELLDKG